MKLTRRSLFGLLPAIGLAPAVIERPSPLQPSASAHKPQRCCVMANPVGVEVFLEGSNGDYVYVGHCPADQAIEDIKIHGEPITSGIFRAYLLSVDERGFYGTARAIPEKSAI